MSKVAEIHVSSTDGAGNRKPQGSVDVAASIYGDVQLEFSEIASFGNGRRGVMMSADDAMLVARAIIVAAKQARARKAK